MRPWVKEDKKIIATLGSHIIHPLWQSAFTPCVCVSVPPKYSVSRYWRMSVTLLQRKSVNIAHPCHCHHKQIPQTLNEQIPQTLNEQIPQTLSWADTSAGSLGMRQPALSVSCASRETTSLQKTPEKWFHSAQPDTPYQIGNYSQIGKLARMDILQVE